MPDRAAVVILTALWVVTGFSGCVNLDETPPHWDQFVPWPGKGETAIYDLHLPPQQRLRLEVEAGGATIILDASGAPIEVLPIEMTAFTDTRGFSRYTQFVDAGGRVPLGLSKCAGITPQFTTEYPCADDRWSATWAEWDLPAAMGTGWLWGSKLALGNASFNVNILGTPHTVDYAIRRAGECVQLEAKDMPPMLGGQRWTLLPAPPVKLLMCAGSAFPAEFDLGAGRYAERQELRSGGPSILPSGRATPPAATVAPTARRADSRGFFDESPITSLNFSAREAYEGLLTEDPAAAEWSRAHPEHALYWTHVDRSFSGTLFTGQQIAESVERALVLSTPAGKALSAKLTKSCQATLCEVRVDSAEEGTRTQPVGLARSIPVDEAFRRAEGLFGTRVTMIQYGRVLVDVYQPAWPRADGIVFVLYGEVAGSAALYAPYHVLIDGLTGQLLSVDAPSSNVRPLVGL